MPVAADGTGDLAREAGDTALRDALFRAHHAAEESLSLHRLHEVVGDLHFEGGQREFRVRGDQDDVGNRLVDVLQDVDAVAARHLDIHEDEVGLVFGDLAARFRRGGGFADDLNVLVGRE